MAISGSLFFLTGFENGLISPASSGGLFSSVGTGWSASTTTPRNGAYCAHVVAPANTATSLPFPIAGFSGAIAIRFGVKVTSRPSSGSAQIAYVTEVGTGKQYSFTISSAGVLSYQGPDGAAIPGPTIDTTSWHYIDFGIFVSGTASKNSAWYVDGVQQTTWQAATKDGVGVNAFNVGTSFATQPAFTADYDDVIGGFGTAPIGDGGVLAQRAGLDGTHATITSLSPGDAGTAYAGTPTNVNTMVDDPPGTGGWTATRSATDNIALRVATVGAYAEIKPAVTAETGQANGVRAIMSYSSSATQANLAACDVRNSENTITELWGLTGGVGKAYNIVANQLKAASVAKPAAGWTAAEINAIRFRFGGCVSADISPVPTVQAMMLEVDWPVRNVPVDETVIDDFNRADGPVYAGAGASIWEPIGTAFNNTTASPGIVSGNQLGSTSASGFIRSVVALQSDFDLLYDVTAAPAQLSTLFALTDLGLAGLDGYMVDVVANGSWSIAYYANGSSTTLVSTAIGPVVAVGSTIWIAKRGTTTNLYHRSSSGGLFALVLTVTDARNNVASPFVFRPNTNTIRWDNVRGGPMAVNPIDETVIDDFNRADGDVFAGAGATIWSTGSPQGGASGLAVVSNQAAKGSGNGDAYLLRQFQADFDYIFDVPTVGLGFEAWINLTPGALYTGILLDVSTSPSDSWPLSRYVNGAFDATLGTATPTATQNGASVWIARRGSTINVYRKQPGGSWALICTGTDATLAGQGYAGLAAAGTANRLDNVRGGPLVPGVVYNDSGSGTVTASGTGTEANVVSTPYSIAVLADGPALYWQLDEASGGAGAKVNDSTGNVRNGTVNNGILGQPGIASGKSYQQVAGSSNGTTADTYMPYAVGSIRTFEGWFNLDSPGSYDQLLGGHTYNACPSIDTGPGTPTNIRWQNGTGSVSWPNVLTRAVPQHVVLIYNDTTRVSELFINGVSQGTKTSPGSYATGYDTEKVKIGYSGVGGGYGMLGLIDEFAVYEYALSPAQIQGHYEIGSTVVNSDSQSGTVTASGTGTESFVYNDSRSGVVTSGGTGIDNRVYDDSAFGAITASGTGTDSRVCADSASGTITSSGTGTDSRVCADSGAGTVTASGTGTESYSDVDSRSGTVTASGIGTESYSYADSSSGTVTATGSGTESYVLPPSAYAAVILADNPVGYWHLKDLTDSSGHNLTLTQSGTVTDVAGLVIGENGAKQFKTDSLADALTHVDDPWLQLGSASTVEAWLNPAFMDQFYAVQKYHTYLLSLESNNKFRVEFWTTGGFWQATGTTVAVLGNTYHVVGTFDGSNVRLYVNGVLEATTAVTGTPVNTAMPFCIGADVGRNGGWWGVVDEVAVYQTVLTPTEIQEHYTVGSGITGVTNNDSGAGTVTASGTGVDARVYSDSGSGTVTASGTGSDSRVYTDISTGTITGSGIGTDSGAYNDTGSGTSVGSGISADSSVYADSGAGTITASGAGIDARVYPDSGSGTVTVTGTGSDSGVYTDTGSGTIVASGAGVDAKVYTDSGAGTVTASGTGTDSSVYADASTGTIAATGISIDAAVYADSGAGTVTVTGTGADARVYPDTGIGTITATGTGVDSSIYADSGNGTIIATGVEVDADVYTDTGTGTIIATGTGTESVSYTASATGTVTVSGSGVESAVHSASATGTIVASGTGTDSKVYDDAASGTALISGTGVESYSVLVGYADANTGQINASGTSVESHSHTSTAIGSVLVTGTSVESHSHTSAAIGTVLVDGTSVESQAYTNTATGSVLVDGTSAESYSHTSTATGSVLVTGTSVESQSYTNTATGSVLVTGTSVESYSHTSTATGVVFVDGTGSETHSVDTSISYTDTSEGIITSTGTGVESASYSNTATGTVTSTGTSVDSAFYSNTEIGTITLFGSGVESYSYTDASTGIIVVTGIGREFGVSTQPVPFSTIIALNRFNVAVMNKAPIRSTVTSTRPLIVQVALQRSIKVEVAKRNEMKVLVRNR